MVSLGGSIGARVAAAITVTAAAVIGVFVVLDAFQTHEEFHDAQRRMLRSMLPGMARIVESAMLRGDRADIHEVFSDLRGQEAFREIELLDARRRRVRTADFGGRPSIRRLAAAPAPEHSEVVEVPLPRRPACVRCHGGGGDTLGYIRVVTALPAAGQALARHAEIRFLMAALALALAGTASMILARRIVDGPVRKVARALERVGQGHLDARIAARLPGELGLISSRFNTMAEQLEKGRREVAELHRRQVTQLDRLVSVGELSANFAHEIRNPLTGIGSAIQVFRRGIAEGDSRREVLSKVLAQVDRLNHTIANFLHYARLPEPELRPFHVRDPLQRVEFLLSDRLRSQGVRFSTDVPADLPLASGDPAQIEQVLLNLCLNAVQAMTRGGRLDVRAVEDASGDVVVEVRDDGPGIAPEHLDDVFVPFFTTRKDGNGLGLPISRQIVEKLGGELWLESVPGAGTSAFVRLARHLDEEA